MTVGNGDTTTTARRWRRRTATALLWYLIPAVAVAAVGAYLLAATVGHVNPPIVPVSGVSMRPTLQAGDLVVLKGVDPENLHKGDIIALNVPSDARKKYNLPAHIVHRIVKVGHDQQGVVFTTQGDANAGPDVFLTHAGDVVGEFRAKLPGFGYPFLFFRARQGQIFLGGVALVVVVYFAMGMLDERRAIAEGSVVTMASVLEETNRLRELLAAASDAPPRAPPSRSPQSPPAAAATGDSVALQSLAQQVATANLRSEQTTQALDLLAGAVSEYAVHLQSHTAVMKNLAAVTADLHRVTSRLAPQLDAPTPEPEASVEELLTAASSEITRLRAENALLRAQLDAKGATQPPHERRPRRRPGGYSGKHRR